MDPIQIVLVIVVLSLTGLALVLGFQVYQILGEIRRSLTKTNKMLDDIGLITESIAKPIAGASGFITGLKSGVGFVKSLLEDKEEKVKKN